MANVPRHVLAFLPNSFGCPTHKGGRDTRVPVLRRFAANLCVTTRGVDLRYDILPFQGVEAAY
ncbi:MAG: hypothetical protein LBQ66_09425 [Planctomycetaceae bacterium]|nr:hypothetical protein [Planctomycetaceae bacterium]